MFEENAELKRQLQKAKAALEALQASPIEQVSSLTDPIYRHLVENLNEGAAILSESGEIFYVNSRLSAIIGLPREQLIGSNLRKYVAQADQPLLAGLFSKAAQEGWSKYEVLLHSVARHAVPVLLSFGCLKQEDRPGILSLIITDLSQQKRQEEITACSKLCREILLQAQQAIAVCDRTGRIIQASRRLHELCGQNPLLLPFHQAFPLKLPSGRTFLLAPLFQGKALHNVEASFQRPDNRETYVLLNAGPLLGPDQEVLGLVLAFTDITARQEEKAARLALLEKLKVNEEELRVSNKENLAVAAALRQSEACLRRACHAGQIGLYELRPERDSYYWSPEMYALMGLDPLVRVDYKRWLGCLHPDLRKEAICQFKEMLAKAHQQEGKTLWQNEFRVVHSEGTVLWLETMMEVGLEEGDLVLRGVARNITERKVAEAVLRRSKEELEETVAARTAELHAVNARLEAERRQIEQSRNMLQLIIESIPVRVFWKDKESRFLGCNTIFAQDAGFDQPRQLIGLDDFAMKWKEQAELYRADDFQVMESRLPVMNIVEPQTTPSGARIWLNTSKVPLAESDGEIFGVLGIYEDITVQKQAEDDLRASLRFLEIVQRHDDVESLFGEFISKVKDYTGCEAVGIRILDADGNIPYKTYDGFSQRFYDATCSLCIHTDNGMCVNVIKGTTDPRSTYYTLEGSFYTNAATRFLTELPEAERGRMCNVCTEMGYQSIALIPCRRGDQIIGLIHLADHRANIVPLPVVKIMEKASMQLVSAYLRLKAEESLRQSEARLRTLYETVQAGVILRNCDGKILHVNRVGCDILAKSQPEIVARPSIHPEWHMVLEDGSPIPCEEQPSMVTLRTGRPIRNAVRGIYSNDTQRTRWLLINTQPIEDPVTSKVKEVTITFLDITDLKRAEAALQKERDQAKK